MAKGVYIGVEKKPTLMLLHGDDLTESANNLPVTNNSVTVVDDAGAFGGKALNFAGSGQHLSITDDTLSLPGDFTIDFRLYNAGSTSWRGIFETAGATSSNWTFHKGGLNISLGDGSNLLFAGIARGGGTYSTLNTPANSVPVGTWSHIALVRSNGVMTFYINGVSSASLSDSEAVTTDGTILIGKHDIRDDMYLNGKIDEFRVSSVARWTSNFTPPTEAYPNDEAGVGIARKVKKMYYGVGNLAKEIKKGYIGIGGVARPFWTNGPGEPMYYGRILSDYNAGLENCSLSYNSGYAIFNGSDHDHGRNLAWAVDKDLMITNFRYHDIYDSCGANFQDFAVFIGGTNVDPYDRTYNSVYTYDINLISQQRTSLPTIDLGNATYNVSTAKIADSLLFMNWDMDRDGNDYGPFTLSYDADFVLSQKTPPSRKRRQFCGTQNENYALYIAGYLRNSMTNLVECFDSNFVKSSTTTSIAGPVASGMTIGKYGCRLGGKTEVYGDDLDLVEGFDEDLIRATPTTLGFQAASIYGGIFKGTPFIKGPSYVYTIDDDFVKTTYEYTVEEYYDGGLPSTIDEQSMLPIDDYFLFYLANRMDRDNYGIHAFKFS